MISMEPTEEDSGEKDHPSLPPNYVSLAQLQERWLRQQKQKQEVEERKEKQEKIQPRQEGGLMSGSRGQEVKGKKKFWGEEHGRGRVESRWKVYRPKGALDGKSTEVGVAETELESEEFTAKTGGMEEKIVTWKNKKKIRKKRVVRVEGSLTGELENGGNLRDLRGRNGGEGGRREEFGTNGDRDGEVERKVSVCMVGVVPENKGKEVALEGMGGKLGGDKGFGGQDWGYRDDWRLGENSSVCIVDELPENGSGEEVPVSENGDRQGMLEEGSVCMVQEVLPENKVEGDSALTVGRKGKGRSRARYQSNVDHSRRWRVSTDSKIELGFENNVVKEGVFGEENERRGDHKGGTARGIQSYGNKEMVSGNPWPKVTRDLRFLSLDESRVGNVALRSGRHGWQQRKYEKSRDVKSLVWMKKREISDTSITEIPRL